LTTQKKLNKCINQQGKSTMAKNKVTTIVTASELPKSAATIALEKAKEKPKAKKAKAGVGGTNTTVAPVKPEYLPKPTADVASSFNWWLDLTTNENWAYQHDLFTADEIAKIIEIGEGGLTATPLTYGSIGGAEGATPGVEDTVKVRRSPIAWIRSDVQENRWIFERLTNAIVSINNQFFNYDLTDIQSLQFTKYDGSEGGFYGKHIDMMYKGTGTRKLSLTVQLSDGNDYEGGDLLLHTRDDPERGFRNKGTATFFPSWTLHEVAPVTKGIRYSLVAWVQGPRFK
jgi:PKHD-type hydroxylase